MPKKSAGSSLVRRSAGDVPPATPGDLARLLEAMDSPVDTSEIPEKSEHSLRVKRDAEGRLPVGRVSPIRLAILAALDRRGMTRYQLWQKARRHCKTLAQSAVYEYLRGQREIGLPYAEALMRAAGLYVSYRKVRRPKAAKQTGAVSRKAPEVAVG